jgi:hypothetical protein
MFKVLKSTLHIKCVDRFLKLARPRKPKSKPQYRRPTDSDRYTEFFEKIVLEIEDKLRDYTPNGKSRDLRPFLLGKQIFDFNQYHQAASHCLHALDVELAKEKPLHGDLIRAYDKLAIVIAGLCEATKLHLPAILRPKLHKDDKISYTARELHIPVISKLRDLSAALEWQDDPLLMLEKVYAQRVHDTTYAIMMAFIDAMLLQAVSSGCPYHCSQCNVCGV